MATIAGSVKSLSSGIFHAKDENGNIRVLQEGDTIYENDTVFGDNGNSSSSKIEILLSGNDVIVLSEGQKQLIDSSLIETAFGTEELFFTREGLDLKADEHNSNADVVSDLRDAEFTNEQKDANDEGAFTDANNSDVTKEETAEGQEEAEDETAPTGEFQARDGNATDIVSDLRNAQFKARTQVFEDKSFFENESKDRLTSLENTDRPSYTNPPITPSNPPANPTPPSIIPPIDNTPPVIDNPTPPIIVSSANLSVNDVSAYESEGFLIFTVTLDKVLGTPITFDYITSPITATNNGVDYKDVKGTITIPAGSTSVTIKVPIVDDYISDNGETMKINISNVVGNVKVSKPEGIGTILDNPVNNPSNGTPETPIEPGGYGEEDTVYAIITGATTVNEGNTTTYTVELVDKDGNAVVVTNATTVTVKYTNVTTQDGDTEYNNNNTISVTIPANGSSNTFTVESIDDYFADNGEKYNVAITKVDTNEFENVVIGDKNGNNKDVTTTILDDTDNTPNNPNDGVEANHESVIIKLVACDASGNPILDADGKTYKIINEVNEGNNAKYMALAFEPNSTTFTTETKLSLQGGTVTVDTANGTAVGVTTQTKEDGTEDFILVKDKVVNIGVAFEVVTVDDYISDNNETYTVSINSGSYIHPTTPIYENVNINTQAVTTTIKDNSNPSNNTTPHNPNDPSNHNQENDKEIVIIKLFAADKSGNVMKDASGNYLLANEAEEGTNANYIAYAFKEGTSTFNDSTKLSVQTGTVNISFQNNTAIGAPTQTTNDGTQDFNNSSKISVSIGQSFSTEVYKDSVFDSTERYTVSIDNNSYRGNYESVNIDTNPVTTTINDEKIFVKIEPITDTTNEGGNLKYKVTIVNAKGEEVEVPVGKTLTVDLSYEGNTSKEATTNIDYTSVTSVTITGGNSSYEFEVPTIDDYYAEGDEGLKITISGTNNVTTQAFENIFPHTTANGAPSNKITTTGTIKDNPAKIDEPNTSTGTDEPSNGNYGEEDTVYAIITGPVNVNEGDTTTSYTIKLVDKDGNEVKVTKDTKITVTYNNTTTQDGDTEYNNGNTIEVTIPANNSSNTFTVDTIDDPYKDDGEKFKLTITDIENTGEFENVKIGDKDGNYKDVTTTIHDNSTNQTTETDVDSVKIVLVAVTSVTTTIADITKPDGTLDIDNTNETPEGGNLYYIAVAVDSDGKPLATQGGIVTINYGITTDGNDKDATAGTDYDNTTVVSTTLGTVFSVNAKDDYYAEGDENFTVKITNLTNSPYESPSIDTSNDTVISTIKDNPAKVEQPDTGTGNDNPTDGNYGKDDTVYVKITKTPSTLEGGDLVHTITLVDKDGNPVTVPVGQTVTVNLTYSVNSGDFTESDLSTIEKSVTIVGGTDHTDFTNVTKDDFTYEGNEVYNVTISSVTQSGAFENVAIHTDKTTTGTIKDGVTIYKDGEYIDPQNAIVDEDNFDVTNPDSSISNKDGNASDGATTYQGEYLNIIKPNTDNNYSLVFDNTINVYSGDRNSTIAFDYGDSRGTTLQSGGVDIEYVVSGNTIIGYQGSGRTDEDRVFEITLNKDSSILTGTTTKDNYTYTQYKNIDHPIGGTIGTDSGIDDNITFEFGFKITDQGQTSDVVNFKVTVNDSLPKATNWTENVNEDGSVKIVISPENFLDGKIDIRVKDGDSFTTLSKDGTIRVFDPNDSTKEIGTLTNNGDGTVSFKPDADYSNYDAKPWFEYAVSDFDGDKSGAKVSINVKPVADAPTIFVKDITTSEDAGNTQEGTNKVNLELKVPFLSKDSDATAQTSPSGYTAKQNSNTTVANPTLDGTGDYNTSLTGDNPERNGEITLTFTNGDKVNGAKVFNGATQIATINSANQTLKILIVKTSGGTDIDYDYHHASVTAGQANTLYLTKAEYEALEIQHAEDNDTDIKIKIGVTSYEVDDSGKPLDTTTYGSQVENETTANMTVKINPVTDKFTLDWDSGISTDSSNDVYISGDTVIFKNIQEYNPNPQSGSVIDTSIDLKALLTNTSGTSSVGGTDTSLDLDGSEKRSYTIKLTAGANTELPEYIYITIGDKTDVKVYKDTNDEYTIDFNDNANKTADPDFSMKFPDYWSGKVTGTITLTSQDKGVDSTDTAGTKESDSVNFEVTVEPVAQLATIQVAQSVGYEDAGRTDGNSSTPNNTIDDPSSGIPLNIKISSDDKDGSETFNVKIEDIPDGSVLYVFDKSLNSGTGDWVLVDKDFVSSGNITVTQNSGKYTIEINDYQNDKLSKFIPPHNDDTDYKLKVSSQTVDNNGTTTDTSAWTDAKDIDVIVKNIADAPVGIDLHTSINEDEDNKLNLQNIYTTPADLASYDGSEELTVKIDLPAGFTVDSGSPYYIEDGMYVVKASDIKAGNILINVPENFSGSASFDLTYVTTEKAGENDSKTWGKQTVNIFVNPIADNVNVATSSTIYEDADGSANKINITPSLTDTDGSESITSVKILASDVPAGFKLYSDASMTAELTTTDVSGTDYYVLTQTQWENGIYVKNTTLNEADSSDNFNLTVVYTVKDTATGTSDVTDDFTHTHTVNVQAVTDAPSLSVGTITQESGNVTVNGTTVTINQEDSQFKVSVTTTSSDTDGSETVQQIVISGVPMGVEVIGATYYGYSGNEHNGIWIITAPTDSTLDVDGALQDITFKVNQGANFDNRDITITTYTKDIDAEVKSASQTIKIEKAYTAGTEPGNPAVLELVVKEADIQEDTEFTLADVLVVNEITAGDVNGKTIITFTNIAEGTTVSGHDYEYVENGKTVYVVIGNGNAADMNTELSNVKITTPKDVNSQQDGALKGDFTFTADIVTYHNGGFNNGNTVTLTPEETITPLTDEMTVAVTADNINEDGTSNLSITLSNPSDGTKTELIGNSITIKVTEIWADVATGGETKGTLTDSSGKYNVFDNGDGTFTITPINVADNFTVGTPITGLEYTSASNRDGNVTFEVSVQNKETGSSVTLDSKGSTTISVTPVIDVVLDASVVTATGTEDVAVTVGSTTLANPVKLEITSGTFSDGSEKLGNIILDEVPNGFTVWYKVGLDLVMATNIGQSGSNTFDLTPNISGDADVHRNKWLIPASADGSMPEVYINAPENWSGDFDFKAKFTVSEQNLSTSTPIEVDVTGHIVAVADGVTIDPTMTFGDAYSWVSLNLNANMKDTDGSETMSLELSGLDESAQFRYSDGTVLSGAIWDGNKWTIEGIAFDQINNIELLHDKSVLNVSVTAKTVDTDGTTTEESSTVNSSFDLKLSDVSGNFTLDTGVSLDFDKIADLSSNSTLKNINTIDLSQSGENKLENITLQDVLNMTDSSNTLKITGTNEDKVIFSDSGWSKTAGSGSDSGFDVYTNTNDNSVQVKVEQNIQDQII